MFTIAFTSISLLLVLYKRMLSKREQQMEVLDTGVYRVGNFVFFEKAVRRRKIELKISNIDKPKRVPYNYKTLIIPKDTEGYVQSFSVDQADEIRKFFDKYGIVVVRDVLTKEECERTENEVWDGIYDLSNGKCLRNDPTTWEKWFSLSKLGILGDSMFMSKQACENRQNPKIHQVFKILFGTEKLLVAIDRVGMMRPTRNVKWKVNGKEVLVDKPEWKTASQWLHLDMNPYTQYTSSYGFTDKELEYGNSEEVLKVQGILALVDCSEKDGGFHAVPGFHKHIKGWTYENLDHCITSSKLDPTTVQIPKNDRIRKDIQTLPIRKGSILIWDSRIPHGSYPNDSDKFRLIQYLKMAPITDKSIGPFITDKKYLPPDFKLTELGEKLYGFKSWE